MKRALIFYNGNLTDLSYAKRYITETDYIICADGGTEHALKLGLTPHTIIGDLDSLSKDTRKQLVKKQIDWVTFPKEKDETDSELALTYAMKKGYTNLLIFGLFGTRLDHMLTNIFALSYLEEKGITVTFVEGKQEIRVTRNTITVNGNRGDLVSLVPLQSDIENVRTTNLAYKLMRENLHFGFSRGISNVMIAKKAEISITSGLLLVIHTRK
jgi:thiamine pyrophosphokinase